MNKLIQFNNFLWNLSILIGNIFNDMRPYEKYIFFALANIKYIKEVGSILPRGLYYPTTILTLLDFSAAFYTISTQS